MFRFSTVAAALLLAAPQANAAADATRALALEFDDWNITALPDIVVDFSDAGDGQEIQHKYIVHDRNVTVKILPGGCNGTVTNNPAAITATAVETDDLSTDLKNVTVNVAIDQSAITASDYFSYADLTTNATAQVEYCLRLDLIMNDNTNTSVNFHETDVTLDIDMTAGFTITGVDTNRTAANETQENATVNYTVVAHQCASKDGVESASTLSQGSTLNACIKSGSTGVVVKDITKFTVNQVGTTEQEALPGGVAGMLSSEDCADGNCYVVVMLQSKFFADPDPNNITVDGECILGFGSGRRLANVVDGRSLQEEQASSFDMQVGVVGNGFVESDEPDINVDLESAGTFIKTSVVSFAVAAFAFFLM